MIETIRLRGGITFHACRDSRFKQGCMSIQFMLPLCREDAAKNALVPAVLLRGSRQYPDIRAITNGLDSLYGSEALDISTDITVLEGMLQQEGLTGVQMPTEK